MGRGGVSKHIRQIPSLACGKCIITTHNILSSTLFIMSSENHSFTSQHPNEILRSSRTLQSLARAATKLASRDLQTFPVFSQHPSDLLRVSTDNKM